MILVSAHLDRIQQDFNLCYNKGIHKGLLDNWLGILITYLALYDDKNIQKFEEEGKFKIFHGQGEEWGRTDDFPALSKKDIALVCDVASGKNYKGIDFALENIYGLPEDKVKDLKENLKWEGFNVRFTKYTGKDEEEDEAWKWKEKGIPTLSFICPIDGDSWHGETTISYERVKRAAQGLKRTLCYLI